MKKSKLIATLCALIFTLACLSFGVYASITTSFIASGTVIFKAYNLDIDVKGTIKGTAKAVGDFYATSTYSATAKEDANRQLYNQKSLNAGWTFGDIAFDELGANRNGYIDNTITITLSFTNYSTFPVEVNVTQTSTNANLIVTKNDIQYIATYDTSTLNIADTQDVTITIIPNGSAILKENLTFDVSVTPSLLQTATVSELTYAIVDDKAVISAYTGTSDTFIIPRTIVDNGSTYTTTLNAGTYNQNETPSRVPGVTLPKTVKSIVIPGTISKMSDMVFQINNNIKKLTVGTGVTSIGYQNFLSCTALTAISIPSSVASIGSSAFGYCGSLTTVIIPNSVTNIGSYAFNFCTNLTRIVISSNVNSIGNYAFNNCKKLTSIEFNGTKQQWNAITFGTNWNSSTADYIVHCIDGDIAKG